MADEKSIAREHPGQLRRGFNVLARDLDRALAIGRFDWPQMLLIEQSRELSWTSSRIARSDTPNPFKINISALARTAQCERAWLSKKFKKLVEARVMIAREDGLFLINKDFRLWLDEDGQPRLDEAQIEWCLEARRRLKDATDQQIPCVSPDTGDCVSPDTGDCVSPDTPPVSLQTQEQTDSVSPQTHALCLPRHTPVSPQTQAHREERAPGEFLESRENTHPEGACAQAHANGCAATAHTPTLFAPDLGKASGKVPAPGRDSAEAKALEAWAQHLGTDTRAESYARWARHACDYAPPTWVRVLLERKVKGRTNLPGIGLLNTILGDWLRAGECEYLRPASSGGQRRPPSPAVAPASAHLVIPPEFTGRFVPKPRKD